MPRIFDNIALSAACSLGNPQAISSCWLLCGLFQLARLDANRPPHTRLVWRRRPKPISYGLCPCFSWNSGSPWCLPRVRSVQSRKPGTRQRGE